MKRSRWWTLCSAFAMFWVILAYMGVASIFTALLALASVAMIAIPVGKDRDAIRARKRREII